MRIVMIVIMIMAMQIVLVQALLGKVAKIIGAEEEVKVDTLSNYSKH